MRNIFFHAIRLLSAGCAALLIAGCSTHGYIADTKQAVIANPNDYSLDKMSRKDGTLVILALSGGGTRAAAFSYGVLEELRDTEVETADGRSKRMLDELDVISSVSGGSFVSAYYGLFGDDIFLNFEKQFLRQNIQGHLERTMYNPLEWFNRTGRVEKAIEYYQEILFNNATYADLNRADGPLILINSSDLCYGVRFTFIQEYFNLLGSDIATFPVAEAVTASSAVPILFDPVVVRNFPSPNMEKNSPWLASLEERRKSNPSSDRELLWYGLSSYLDKENHKYIHFVDGGITDNLGLRAILNLIEIDGGIKPFSRRVSSMPEVPFKRIVVILVNAATHHPRTMDRENKQPHITETVSAVSHIQMERYSEATLQLMEDNLNLWVETLSTPEQPVDSYFIHVRFEDEKDPLALKLYNALPTSFSLQGHQIDHLIKGGRELLRDNPEFQRLLKNIHQQD